MHPQKLGLAIVLLCIAAFFVFIITVRPAHASTGDKLSPSGVSSPTPRDWQRLNACAGALLTYGKTPDKNQEARAVKCAAIGKAVSHIESAKGTSYYAKTRRNLYGIRYWDKNRNPHIKTYKTYMESHQDFARIYFTFYEGLSNKAYAAKWTGEPFIVKSYTAHLNKWVPAYTKLYNSMK